MLAPWKKSYDQPGQHIKKQKHYFADKCPSSQSYGFSSTHVWMGELSHKESWVPKNWCFWTRVLEKAHESILDCKEIKSVNPKGNQSWIFIGRTDVEAETPILWPPDVKNWLIGKDPDAVKDWRQEENGTTEDEMVGCHHQLYQHEFEQPPGVGDAIQPSHPLLSPSPPTFNLSQHQGCFKCQYFTSGGQSIGVSASTSVLPMNIRSWFPLGWTGLISLQSKGLSRVFSSTTVQKHQFFSTQPALWSSSHIHTWPLERP